MNQLYSSTPAISPAIRNWLQEECELIEDQASRQFLGLAYMGVFVLSVYCRTF
jgi:hypothetical protein